MTTVASTLMTAEEFLALPDDGIERWLIDGQLKERPMTYHDRWHCQVVTHLAKFLGTWLDEQTEPRGEVLAGNAGFGLSKNPDTIVGIDVAYVSADVIAAQRDDSPIVEGSPVLAVDVLARNDTSEQIIDKINAYRRARVPLVWMIDTDDRTILVYRIGEKPRLVNDSQELSADPELPGFRVAASRIFE